MHILFLLNRIDENSGGAERFAAGLAIDLRKAGFEVTCCTTRHMSEDFRMLFDQAGVRSITLDRRAKWDVYKLWKLRRILKDSRVDVLHAHLFGSNVWGSLMGRIAGTPIVIAHDHSWSYEGNQLRRFLDGQLVGNLADVFVAVCEKDAQRMVSYEKVPAEKVRVLPIASPGAADSAAPPWEVRTELDLPAYSKIVSVAARLAPEKRLDVLLEAMAIVVKSRPDTHLVVVGDGPCREEWEHLAADLGMSDHVHFLGYRTNVIGLLMESECAVMSSDREGMPLFVVESLAAGTPVVATDVGSIRQMIRENETGYVVPRRNHENMAKAVLRILEEPSARDRMGPACRAEAAKYTMDSVSRQFAGLYTGLAHTRGLVS
jgi:glycosyltransferase involved in cell wall biosynthesis